MEAATKKRKKDLEESESPFLRETLKWETLANLYSQGTSSDILDLYESTFSDIAHNLLNKTYMVINGQKHRLVEIEFYYKNGGNHDDPFTHGDAIQLTSGKWYFHRMGNGYKGGSYKGLDITFGGQGAEDSKVYGGILIRAIEPIEGGGKSTSLIEGPSKVVDRVLELNGSTGIAEFVSAHFNNAAAPPAHHNEESRLYLIPAEQMQENVSGVADSGKGKETEEKEEEKAEALPILEIYRSSRVGLSLKRERAGLDTFVGRCYRFTSRPAWMKKGKPNMIIGLHQQGIAVPQIATIMKTAAKTITGYIEHYKAGQKKTPATFMGKALTTQSLCELLGAVSPGAQASLED